MAQGATKAEWRCVSTKHGGLYVVMAGMRKKRMSFVVNLDFLIKVYFLSELGPNAVYKTAKLLLLVGVFTLVTLDL